MGGVCPYFRVTPVWKTRCTSRQKFKNDLQGYLAHMKTSSPRNIQWAYASSPMGVLGGWTFFYGRGTPVTAPITTLELPSVGLAW